MARLMPQTPRTVKTPIPKKKSIIPYILCLLFLVIVYLLSCAALVAHKLVNQHDNWAEAVYDNGNLLTPQNESRNVAWSSCQEGDKDDQTLRVCSEPWHFYANAYNSDHSFKLVRFPSRKGPDGQKTADLTAWWLPSGNVGAPRVVLQHGNDADNANFNGRIVFLTAYMLRSIGISVLVPNLRDHGLSEQGTGKVTWSYEYPYDTLGAWDYAVNDPDGELGGVRKTSEVGLMGMCGMGGYLAASAFGLEQAVPAIWDDSGIYTFEGMTTGALAHYVGPLASLLSPTSVAFASNFAGVDVTLNSPEKTLPRGPDSKRPVAVISSNMDTWVPTSETLNLATYVDNNPDKYSLSETWTPNTEYNSNPHCSAAFGAANDYRRRLFEFWCPILGCKQDESVLSTLPDLDEFQTTTLTTWTTPFQYDFSVENHDVHPENQHMAEEIENRNDISQMGGIHNGDQENGIVKTNVTHWYVWMLTSLGGIVVLGTLITMARLMFPSRPEGEDVEKGDEALSLVTNHNSIDE